MSATIVIVGAGVLGSMHAYRAVAAGHRVIHLEREADARGASVRNFGLVWVSGRAPGADLALSLRARELWEDIAEEVPGVGFRANGSLTVVTDPSELAVLQQVCARDDATARGFELVDSEDIRDLNPAVRGEALAALFARRDAAVEPREVPRALRAHLTCSGLYSFHPGVEIVDIADRAGSVGLTDARGRVWEGDRAILCTGAWHNGVAAPWLSDVDRPPVRRVRLQMMQTKPLRERLTTSVADADSLRYYPAFQVPALSAMTPQAPLAANWGMQLLMVQRLDGGLTIGDTHRYDEPFDFDVQQEPYDLLAARAERILGHPLPSIARRWSGIYSQLLPDAREIYFHREVTPGVWLITGPGGRGMTHSPAIAEQTLKDAGLS